MAILSKYKLEEYQYGAQVRKGRQLYMMSEKKIYFGDWLIDKTDQIIIIEMTKEIAEREAPFYLEVNGHENIIRTFGSIGNPSNLTIYVQEYAPRGDLADCLMDNQFQFTQPMLVQMFAQIADAMSYVASKKIVHGDLGCRNILVFRLDSNTPKNNLVKITDFGLARWIDRAPANEDTTIVPIRYCAPEILRNNRHSSYSEKSDVYSMGVLIWEALSNSEIPYSSVAQDEDVRQKKLNNERLPQPQGSDRQLWVLMNECWHKDPQQRPTFNEITDKLSNMNISEVPHDLITASLHKSQIHCDYELDIDVKVKGLLYNGYYPIYEAQWISEEERPIVLIEKKEEPSVHEKLFYTKFKNHPHIIHTFGFVGNDRRTIMILQERAPHGNLRSVLESGQFQPSGRVLLEIFSQIINAMIDIVGQGLVHGDLRCENILVFQMHPSDPKRNLVKLTNFALARPNDSSHTDDRRLFVPVRHCALEILRSAGHSNYSELSDVYSMGVLMWQAFSKGKRPYDSSETNGEVRQRKLKGEKLSRPILCHEKIWEIIFDCWHNEPALRFEFKDMKTRFANIGSQPIEPYQYELNKHVRQNRSLNGMNGRFYEADWIPKRDPPILLFVIDGPVADREALLYIKFSSHSHIIHTFGLVKNDQQSIMLLQERAPHGNLQTLLQSGNFQPLPQVLVEIFLQIVDAMIYVTGQGIIHGDLRCANILVFEMDISQPKRNLVKLTNFSFARTKDQSIMNNRLPDSHVRYCAPEILDSEDGSNYSELSDVYSLGVLMWETCSKGEVPYGRRTNDHDIRQQKLKDQNLTQPKGCPDPLWTVMRHCWLRNLSIRFTFKELETNLSGINVTTIPLRHCYNCKNDFPENEMEHHQQSCLPPMPPINRTDQYKDKFTQSGQSNKGYDESDKENDSESPPTKRPRSESSNLHALSTRFNDSDAWKNNKVIQKSPPIQRQPSASLERPNLAYNNQSYSDDIGVYQSKPRPKLPTSATRPQVPDATECTRCHRNIPLDRIDAHEASCQPPTRSFWSRICPCLRLSN